MLSLRHGQLSTVGGWGHPQETQVAPLAVGTRTWSKRLGRLGGHVHSFGGGRMGRPHGLPEEGSSTLPWIARLLCDSPCRRQNQSPVPWPLCSTGHRTWLSLLSTTALAPSLKRLVPGTGSGGSSSMGWGSVSFPHAGPHAGPAPRLPLTGLCHPRNAFDQEFMQRRKESPGPLIRSHSPPACWGPTSPGPHRRPGADNSLSRVGGWV